MLRTHGALNFRLPLVACSERQPRRAERVGSTWAASKRCCMCPRGRLNRTFSQRLGLLPAGKYDQGSAARRS